MGADDFSDVPYDYAKVDIFTGEVSTASNVTIGLTVADGDFVGITATAAGRGWGIIEEHHFAPANNTFSTIHQTACGGSDWIDSNITNLCSDYGYTADVSTDNPYYQICHDTPLSTIVNDYYYCELDLWLAYILSISTTYTETRDINEGPDGYSGFVTNLYVPGNSSNTEWYKKYEIENDDSQVIVNDKRQITFEHNYCTVDYEGGRREEHLFYKDFFFCANV